MVLLEKCLDQSFGGAGPSPWCFKSKSWDELGYSWISISGLNEKKGKTALYRNGKIILVVGYCDYIMPLSNTILLIYQVKRTEVNIITLDLQKLTPFEGNISDVCQEMDYKKINFTFQGQAFLNFSLSTLEINKDIHYDFPNAICKIDELLILCKSISITDPMNLALIVAKPSSGLYHVYPQEWFNKGEFDYGYEWVTKVFRNPKTGFVHGEGMRLNPFVLDQTLKNVISKT